MFRITVVTISFLGITLVTLPFLIVIAAIAARAEDPPLSVLLEKGIFAEETEGNLEEAIEIYRQIADKTEANREIVAQAKLRLGECYLELAKVQFQSLADQYGDQEQTASKALERLASMGLGEVPQDMGTSAKPRYVVGLLLSDRYEAGGWSLWKEGKFQEAQFEFERAIQVNSKNADAWNGLGWSHFNQNKPQPAAVAFDKCLEIEPEHPAALNGLGWIAKGEGRIEEAIEYWTRAVDVSPNATAALNGLALTYMEQEEYEKAVETYKMWRNVDPTNQQVLEGFKEAESRLLNRRGKSLPDLVAKKLDLIPYPEGGLYRAVVNIRNEGAGRCPSVKTVFYRGNPKEGGEPIHEGWNNTGPIEPGAEWNEGTGPFALNEGKNEFTVVVDVDNEVVETDESNNSASYSITVESASAETTRSDKE